MPSIGRAQEDERIAQSMQSLMAMTAKLGVPKLDGKEAVGGKDAPALVFRHDQDQQQFRYCRRGEKEDGKE